MAKCAGAQLYTVREYARTPEEIADVFARVRKIGYKTVQASGLGPIAAEELAAIAKVNGISIVITHTPYDKFVHDLDQVIRDHHTLGCTIAGLGAIPKDMRHEEGYHAFAKQFSAIADELARNGLKFSYHNHHFEFQAFGKRRGIDILMEETNPETFLFTPDVYWIQVGGGDPAAWIRKLKGRVEAVHLKDLTIIDEQQVMTEIMAGNLNWPAIFEACEEAGVKWYLVERDAGPTEAFESLRISYENLKTVGFE